VVGKPGPSTKGLVPDTPFTSLLQARENLTLEAETFTENYISECLANAATVEPPDSVIAIPIVISMHNSFPSDVKIGEMEPSRARGVQDAAERFAKYRGGDEAAMRYFLEEIAVDIGFRHTKGLVQVDLGDPTKLQLIPDRLTLRFKDSTAENWDLDKVVWKYNTAKNARIACLVEEGGGSRLRSLQSLEIHGYKITTKRTVNSIREKDLFTFLLLERVCSASVCIPAEGRGDQFARLGGSYGVDFMSASLSLPARGVTEEGAERVVRDALADAHKACALMTGLLFAPWIRRVPSSGTAPEFEISTTSADKYGRQKIADSLPFYVSFATPRVSHLFALCAEVVSHAVRAGAQTSQIWSPLQIEFPVRVDTDEYAKAFKEITATGRKPSLPAEIDNINFQTSTQNCLALVQLCVSATLQRCAESIDRAATAFRSEVPEAAVAPPDEDGLDVGRAAGENSADSEDETGSEDETSIAELMGPALELQNIIEENVKNLLTALSFVPTLCILLHPVPLDALRLIKDGVGIILDDQAALLATELKRIYRLYSALFAYCKPPPVLASDTAVLIHRVFSPEQPVSRVKPAERKCAEQLLASHLNTLCPRAWTRERPAERHAHLKDEFVRGLVHEVAFVYYKDGAKTAFLHADVSMKLSPFVPIILKRLCGTGKEDVVAPLQLARLAASGSAESKYLNDTTPCAPIFAFWVLCSTVNKIREFGEDVNRGSLMEYSSEASDSSSSSSSEEDLGGSSSSSSDEDSAGSSLRSITKNPQRRTAATLKPLLQRIKITLPQITEVPDMSASRFDVTSTLTHKETRLATVQTTTVIEVCRASVLRQWVRLGCMEVVHLLGHAMEIAVDRTAEKVIGEAEQNPKQIVTAARALDLARGIRKLGNPGDGEYDMQLAFRLLQGSTGVWAGFKTLPPFILELTRAFANAVTELVLDMNPGPKGTRTGVTDLQGLSGAISSMSLEDIATNEEIFARVVSMIPSLKNALSGTQDGDNIKLYLMHMDVASRGILLGPLYREVTKSYDFVHLRQLEQVYFLLETTTPRRNNAPQNDAEFAAEAQLLKDYDLLKKKGEAKCNSIEAFLKDAYGHVERGNLDGERFSDTCLQILTGCSEKPPPDCRSLLASLQFVTWDAPPIATTDDTPPPEKLKRGQKKVAANPDVAVPLAVKAIAETFDQDEFPPSIKRASATYQDALKSALIADNTTRVKAVQALTEARVAFFKLLVCHFVAERWATSGGSLPWAANFMTAINVRGLDFAELAKSPHRMALEFDIEGRIAFNLKDLRLVCDNWTLGRKDRFTPKFLCTSFLADDIIQTHAGAAENPAQHVWSNLRNGDKRQVVYLEGGRAQSREWSITPTPEWNSLVKERIFYDLQTTRVCTSAGSSWQDDAVKLLTKAIIDRSAVQLVADGETLMPRGIKFAIPSTDFAIESVRQHLRVRVNYLLTETEYTSPASLLADVTYGKAQVSRYTIKLAMSSRTKNSSFPKNKLRKQRKFEEDLEKMQWKEVEVANLAQSFAIVQDARFFYPPEVYYCERFSDACNKLDAKEHSRILTSIESIIDDGISLYEQKEVPANWDTIKESELSIFRIAVGYIRHYIMSGKAATTGTPDRRARLAMGTILTTDTMWWEEDTDELLWELRMGVNTTRPVIPLIRTQKRDPSHKADILYLGPADDLHQLMTDMTAVTAETHHLLDTPVLTSDCAKVFASISSNLYLVEFERDRAASESANFKRDFDLFFEKWHASRNLGLTCAMRLLQARAEEEFYYCKLTDEQGQQIRAAGPSAEYILRQLGQQEQSSEFDESPQTKEVAAVLALLRDKKTYLAALAHLIRLVIRIARRGDKKDTVVPRRSEAAVQMSTSQKFEYLLKVEVLPPGVETNGTNMRTAIQQLANGRANFKERLLSPCEFLIVAESIVDNKSLALFEKLPTLPYLWELNNHNATVPAAIGLQEGTLTPQELARYRQAIFAKLLRAGRNAAGAHVRLAVAVCDNLLDPSRKILSAEDLRNYMSGVTDVLKGSLASLLQVLATTDSTTFPSSQLKGMGFFLSAIITNSKDLSIGDPSRKALARVKEYVESVLDDEAPNARSAIGGAIFPILPKPLRRIAQDEFKKMDPVTMWLHVFTIFANELCPNPPLSPRMRLHDPSAARKRTGRDQEEAVKDAVEEAAEEDTPNRGVKTTQGARNDPPPKIHRFGAKELVKKTVSPDLSKACKEYSVGRSLSQHEDGLHNLNAIPVLLKGGARALVDILREREIMLGLSRSPDAETWIVCLLGSFIDEDSTTSISPRSTLGYLLAYETHGPPCSDMVRLLGTPPAAVLQVMREQGLGGLAFIHGAGVCHGQPTLANLVYPASPDTKTASEWPAASFTHLKWTGFEKATTPAPESDAASERNLFETAVSVLGAATEQKAPMP
jgi:hypothetical protein